MVAFLTYCENPGFRVLCEEVGLLAAIDEEKLPDEGGVVVVWVENTISSFQAILFPNPY